MVCKKVNEGIAEYLRAQGLGNVSELVGTLQHRARHTGLRGLRMKKLQVLTLAAARPRPGAGPGCAAGLRRRGSESRQPAVRAPEATMRANIPSGAAMRR